MVLLRTILAGAVLLLLLACTAPLVSSTSVASSTPNTTSQTVYYVAPNGNDKNPGTKTRPWRTIQHAADTVKPGDAVYVRAGIYAEDVAIHVSGTASDGYITFRNYPGETPILDGSNLTVPPDKMGLFYIQDQHHLIIQGFELRNYQSSAPDIVPIGIHIRGKSHHIQLLNNHIHHIASTAPVDAQLSGRDAHGIAVYGDDASEGVHDLLIAGNELDHLTLGSSEALVLNGNVSQFVVQDNIIHDNDNIGIDAIGFEGVSPNVATDQAREGIITGNVIYNIDSRKNPAYGGEASAGGIYVDGGAHITIRNNRVFANNIGVEIASEHPRKATRFITVTNNLIYWNHLGGLFMGGYDSERGSTEDCMVVNNTFFQNDLEKEGNGEILLQFDTKRNIIANNILYAHEQGVLITNPYSENIDNRVDYNLYYSPLGQTESVWQWKGVYYQGFREWQEGAGHDAHGLFADPQFTDLLAPDLRFPASSPAIDIAASEFAPPDDFWGTARPQGKGVDVGAYEFVHHNLFLPNLLFAQPKASSTARRVPGYALRRSNSAGIASCRVQ